MSSEDSHIDPSWWAEAFVDADDDGPRRVIELASMRIADLAVAAPAGSLQSEVLTALHLATSAMLRPENWDEPFKPMVVWDGQRSALPDDLDGRQLELLRRVLPFVEERPLRARLADVLWMADRSDHATLGLAIDSYRAAGLEPDNWHKTGHTEWQRAIDLTRRRGRAELARLQAMTDTLHARVLIGDRSDGFVLCDMSDMLKKCASLEAPERTALATKFVELAAEGKGRLSRHMERTAQQWLASVGDQEGQYASAERVAELYVAEAEERLAAGSGAALGADHFLEKAIATLRALPRSYRIQHGHDQRLEELRRRMDDCREQTLESMMRITTDPIDLTEAVAETRRRVSGLAKFKALVAMATVYPLADIASVRAHAEELAEGSLRHLLGNVTYNSDGRKVASSEGAVDHAEAAIRSDMIRGHQLTTGIVATGFIIPAHEVVTFEHRYDLGFLRRVCVESPLAPSGHEDLWARGLRHGLNRDFASAAAILIPQIEQLVRGVLKRHGVHTLFVDSYGVESEKSLSSLLAMSETAQILGESLQFELQATLIEQNGPNLRHNTAHGLLDDSQAWSASSVYVWWLCMRLVVVPLWNMTRSANDEASEGGDAPTPPGDASGTPSPH
ncbi:DUF4209 domain-containing protein [Dietzia sp. PP-33]|jgi:hypothetical protein|uniref:DUF4209 domain-containing protein n=1 Tax=Dietzia sp. PP-33 TaxID=2957500 RepID=UPI0029AA2792|nr:DUF4209 domain-containing protein [Dietzia sp. PP-33]MDX2355626.1 DUF4209 domain-containing protein [Dietzia sp. PP-33]